MNLRSVNIFKAIRPKDEEKIPINVAYNTTIEQLRPLLTRANDEGLFLRNRHSLKTYTLKQLVRLLEIGQMVQGPSHWHLVDAQGRRVA